MPAPRKYTDEQRAEMCRLVKSGRSVNSVAKEYGCATTTVSGFVKERGVDAPQERTKQAREALKDYTVIERIKLLNRAFDKAAEFLDAIDNPRELQAIATTLAILIDKRRLEDGQVTARDEHVTAGSSEQLASRIDSLAERLRSKSAA